MGFFQASEYFVLKKVPCTDCKGTGLYISREFSTGMGEVVTREQDCKICEGKSFFYDPVKLDWDLFDEILRSFHEVT